MPNVNDDLEFNQSSLTLQSFLLLLVAMVIGLQVAVMLLPVWMPNMAVSLAGDAPKAYWYLSRGTAFVALSLLWISMALGLGITNKMARSWPGAPAAFAIHEYVSLLGLAFAAFHALVLMGDHYINFTLLQVIIPFASTGYRPFWVGLGQVGFYTWVIVALSFYVRQHIGHKSWRFIHYASFLMYLIALLHGLISGTDTSLPWAQWYYWISAGSLIFLLAYRLVAPAVDRLSLPVGRVCLCGIYALLRCLRFAGWGESSASPLSQALSVARYKARSK
jgi:predicted ferric reductase